MLHPQTQKLRPALPSDALTKLFQGPTTRACAGLESKSQKAPQPLSDPTSQKP